MKRKKRIATRGAIAVMAAVIVLGVAVSVVADIGNDFRYSSTTHSVAGPQGDLEVVLAQPDAPPVGTVLMIHGDGPIDATNSALYAPWFEAAADAGYATVSWSKPGVAGSEGSWEAQSMADRARESGAVIEWLQRSSVAPSDRLVLWAASQGGWVFPAVALEHPDVEGVVAVGTAINWLDQGRYNLEAELDAADADAEARADAIAVSDCVRLLLDSGASYAEYRDAMAGMGHRDLMSPGRWAFAAKNFAADATHDIHRLAERGIPVALFVGDRDLNVDTIETEAVYRDALGDLLIVERFDAPDSLARPVVESNEFIGVAVAVAWPRALTAPGVLDAYTETLRHLDRVATG